MPLTNHFAAEPLIIQRLKDQNITGINTVASGSILAGAQDLAPYLDGIFVLPDEGIFPEAPNDGRLQLESQHWQIITVVKNIRDPNDVNTTAKLAGGYITEILKALIGWPPAKELTPITISARPKPYYEPGYGEFPLILSTTTVIRGSSG